MNSKIFQLGCRSFPSGIRSAFGVAAYVVISTAASSPACSAQIASVITPAPPSAVVAASIPGVSSITRVTSSSDTLHILVGHSLFLNTKVRLKRIYIADPAILNSITLTPNQIIVTAVTPGVTSLILLDETGQAQSYVISSDLDVQGLRNAISEATRNDAVSAVNVEGNGDRVLLSGRIGSDALAATAVKLAGLYSKDVANSLTVAPEHPKQVRLKVRILEVDRSKANQLGINLFNPGGNTSFLASTTTSQFPSTSSLSNSPGNLLTGTLTTSSPLNFLLYSSKLNLGATVQDLENKNILQILAEPTITTISGQKADFLSGGEFPFPVIQPGGGAGASSSVTIQFKPYGVKLEFTPIVNDDGTIRLKVAPEVSALDYTNAVTISGYSIPALSSRKADTEVELRSDQSFAISGLLDQRTTDLLSKTPGIASIPIIGALFKSKNISHSITELVVIVTPTLVDPLTDTILPAQPDLPIPMLNPGAFDKSLGKNLNPNPAPPPINPSPQPAVNQVAPPSLPPAPVATPSTGTTQNITPPEAPHSVPIASPARPDIAYGASAAPTIVPTPSQSTAPNVAAYQSPAPADVSVASVAPAALLSPEVPQRYVFDDPAATSAPVAPATPQPSANVSAPAMVQIMALSHKEDADAMVVALKRHGYDVAVTQDPTDSRLHIEVGPFKSKADAEAMQQRLLTDGYNAIVR